MHFERPSLSVEKRGNCCHALFVTDMTTLSQEDAARLQTGVQKHEQTTLMAEQAAKVITDLPSGYTHHENQLSVWSSASLPDA